MPENPLPQDPNTGPGEATVVVAPLEPDDEKAAFEQDGSNSSIFVDYAVTNRYEKDYHRYMLGLTSPTPFKGDGASFVQLAAPTLLWIADWSASRWNELPPIPDPDVSNDWVLLDEHIDAAQLFLSADGVTPRYRISGTYVYGKAGPDIRTTADVIFPKPPWMSSSDFDRTVRTGDLRKDIIDLTAGGSSSDDEGKLLVP